MFNVSLKLSSMLELYKNFNRPAEEYVQKRSRLKVKNNRDNNRDNGRDNGRDRNNGRD